MSGLRPFHAAGLALLLLATVLAAPLLLTTQTHSTLSPSMFDARVVEYEPALAHPPRLSVQGHPAALVLADLVVLDPRRDALLIVQPSVGYSDAEITALRTFLHQGGRVLLADDGGIGHELLQRLDVGIGTSLTSVYSPSFENDPRRVLTTSTGLVPDLGDEVALTRPVLVTGGIPLLMVPRLSWLDENGNNRPDLGEPIATGAAAAWTPVGEGLLVVVGDPDALTRNEPAAAAAFAAVLADGGRRIVVDEGHRQASDPLGANSILAGRVGVVAGTGILITAAAVVAFVVLGPRLRPPAPTRRARWSGRGNDPALVADVLGELREQP